MNQLYIFNPDHDLALASDSDHFDAPLSAKQFATDFSLLPLWYAEKYSCIWAERVDVEWFESMKKLLYGVYHGRFAEMLLSHFDNDIEILELTSKGIKSIDSFT